MVSIPKSFFKCVVWLSQPAHWIQYLISSRSHEPCLYFQFLLLMRSGQDTKWRVFFFFSPSIVSFSCLYNAESSGLDRRGQVNRCSWSRNTFHYHHFSFPFTLPQHLSALILVSFSPCYLSPDAIYFPHFL